VGYEQFAISVANANVENNCTLGSDGWPYDWDGWPYGSNLAMWNISIATAPLKACQIVEDWKATFPPSVCCGQSMSYAHLIGCGSAFKDNSYFGICFYSSSKVCYGHCGKDGASIPRPPTYVL
jgi:hypothetical protein